MIKNDSGYVYRENLFDFENYVKIGLYEEEQPNGEQGEGLNELKLDFDIGDMIEETVGKKDSGEKGEEVIGL